MRRSSGRLRRRRRASTNTARAIGPATAHRLTVHDGSGRLSEGLVLDASVVARLFRFRLLEIEAGLVVLPTRGTSRSPFAPPAGSRAIGAELAAAQRCIDEGAASLAASRAIDRNSAPSRPLAR